MRIFRLPILAAISVCVTLVLGLMHSGLADVGDISVGGVWICRITHDAPGYTAEERAVEVNKRITEILSAPDLQRGAIVSVRAKGKDAVITAGRVLVFTVGPEDAMDTSVTPLELARQWAERLAAGLGQAFPDRDNPVF